MSRLKVSLPHPERFTSRHIGPRPQDIEDMLESVGYGSLDGDPAAVNRDPYGEGWMVRLRPSHSAELKELLDAPAYKAHIGE